MKDNLYLGLDLFANFGLTPFEPLPDKGIESPGASESGSQSNRRGMEKKLLKKGE